MREITQKTFGKSKTVSALPQEAQRRLLGGVAEEFMGVTPENFMANLMGYNEQFTSPSSNRQFALRAMSCQIYDQTYYPENSGFSPDFPFVDFPWEYFFGHTDSYTYAYAYGGEGVSPYGGYGGYGMYDWYGGLPYGYAGNSKYGNENPYTEEDKGEVEKTEGGEKQMMPNSCVAAAIASILNQETASDTRNDLDRKQDYLDVINRNGLSAFVNQYKM